MIIKTQGKANCGFNLPLLKGFPVQDTVAQNFFIIQISPQLLQIDLEQLK